MTQKTAKGENANIEKILNFVFHESNFHLSQMSGVLWVYDLKNMLIMFLK